MDNWHQSQRGYFAGALYDAMLADDSIYLIVVDLGYATFDRHFKSFPNRCINTGASEQAAVGIAVGLAESGMKPFVYTITSFFLRAAETISLYVEHEQVPVVLVGAGREDDYLHDGYTHFGYASEKFLSTNMHLVSYYPKDKLDVPNIIKKMVKSKTPTFISLKR